MPIKIVIAPDSFKECLAAAEVCAAMARGVRMVDEGIEILEVPMADGGEGTIATLWGALPGHQMRSVPCTDPLGNSITADYLLTDDHTAVIETATACGLHLIPPSKRDPRLTTTRGVGELIMNALDAGAVELLLTMGGSGTVDGGTGLARALGYRFYDANEQELAEGGGFLVRLARIESPQTQRWAGIRVKILCDVTNPLLGSRGAAETFAPQKGALPAAAKQLSAGLERLAAIVGRDINCDITSLPGGGAAGGMAAGLVAFMGGELTPGFQAIAEHVRLSDTIRGADLVLTGEGKTDTQTAGGKVCAGVAGLAREHRVPCLVVSGAISPGAEQSLDVTAMLSISRGPGALAAAVKSAGDDLTAAAYAITRTFLAGKQA